MSEYERGYKAAVIDTVKRCVVGNEAEREVIEAAAVCVDGFGEEESAQGLYDRIAMLAFKVEALQKERE